MFVDRWRAVTWTLHVVWGEPGEATEMDAEAETDLHTTLEIASPKESKDKNMITKLIISASEIKKKKNKKKSLEKTTCASAAT